MQRLNQPICQRLVGKADTDHDPLIIEREKISKPVSPKLDLPFLFPKECLESPTDGFSPLTCDMQSLPPESFRLLGERSILWSY